VGTTQWCCQKRDADAEKDAEKRDKLRDKYQSSEFLYNINASV
jgi:hypothetical protein